MAVSASTILLILLWTFQVPCLAFNPEEPGSDGYFGQEDRGSRDLHNEGQPGPGFDDYDNNRHYVGGHDLEGREGGGGYKNGRMSEEDSGFLKSAFQSLYNQGVDVRSTKSAMFLQIEPRRGGWKLSANIGNKDATNVENEGFGKRSEPFPSRRQHEREERDEGDQDMPFDMRPSNRFDKEFHEGDRNSFERHRGHDSGSYEFSNRDKGFESRDMNFGREKSMGSMERNFGRDKSFGSIERNFGGDKGFGNREQNPFRNHHNEQPRNSYGEYGDIESHGFGKNHPERSWAPRHEHAGTYHVDHMDKLYEGDERHFLRHKKPMPAMVSQYEPSVRGPDFIPMPDTFPLIFPSDLVAAVKPAVSVSRSNSRQAQARVVVPAPAAPNPRQMTPAPTTQTPATATPTTPTTPTTTATTASTEAINTRIISTTAAPTSTSTSTRAIKTTQVNFSRFTRREAVATEEATTVMTSRGPWSKFTKSKFPKHPRYNFGHSYIEETTTGMPGLRFDVTPTVANPVTEDSGEMNQLRVEAVTLRPVVLSQRNIFKLIYNNRNVLHNKTNSGLVLRLQSRFTSGEHDILHSNHKGVKSNHISRYKHKPSLQRYLVNKNDHPEGYTYSRNTGSYTEESTTPAKLAYTSTDASFMRTPGVSMGPRNIDATSSTDKPTQFHYPNKFMQGKINNKTPGSSGTYSPARTTPNPSATSPRAAAASSTEGTAQMTEQSLLAKFLGSYQGFKVSGGRRICSTCTLQYCLYSCTMFFGKACSAVDYNTRLSSCYIHNRMSACRKPVRDTDVTHFRRQRCSGQDTSTHKPHSYHAQSAASSDTTTKAGFSELTKSTASPVGITMTTFSMEDLSSATSRTLSQNENSEERDVQPEMSSTLRPATTTEVKLSTHRTGKDMDDTTMSSEELLPKFEYVHGHKLTGGRRICSTCTLEYCLYSCMMFFGHVCYGVDYNTKHSTCYVHNKVTICNKYIPDGHVNHYTRRPCSSQDDSNQNTTTQPTTITTSNPTTLFTTTQDPPSTSPSTTQSPAIPDTTTVTPIPDLFSQPFSNQGMRTTTPDVIPPMSSTRVSVVRSADSKKFRGPQIADFEFDTRSTTHDDLLSNRKSSKYLT